MSVQYQTKVPWDTTLIDVEYTDADTAPVALQGLVKYAVKVNAGAPTATAGVFIPGALISNAVSGVIYVNTGTTATPVWSTIGGGAGNPSLPFNGVQYNNAGAFGADASWTRDPATLYTTQEAVVAETSLVTFTGMGQDDIRVRGNPIFASIGSIYTITISGTGPNDSFDWTCSTGGGATGVSITGGSQTLNNGVDISFNSVTGHTMADSWSFTVLGITTGFAQGSLLGGAINGVGVYSLNAVTNNNGILIFGPTDNGPDNAIVGIFNFNTGAQATHNAGFSGTTYVSKMQARDAAGKFELTLESGITGGMSYNANNNTFLLPVFPLQTPQSLSGAGAANITSYQTKLTTAGTGADVIGLGNSTVSGQVKRINLDSTTMPGDTSVITPTSTSGFTTVTLSAVGGYAIFQWNLSSGSGWTVFETSADAVIA